MKPLAKFSSFLRSPQHAWLALLTLGLGAATLSPIGMVIGAAAYLLGWAYLPGSRWVRSRAGASPQAQQPAEDVHAFVARRREIYDRLPADSRARYNQLAARIEATLAELTKSGGFNQVAARQHANRLTTLGWTYLRLLSTEEALDRFLAGESPEDLGAEIRDLESSLAAIDSTERPRLADSKQARLDSLRARLEKRREAESSRDLVCSEQDRIVDLVKLIQAELLTTRDPSALSGEIDGAAYFLDMTSDWLRDSEFDSSPDDISDTVTSSVPLSISE